MSNPFTLSFGVEPKNRIRRIKESQSIIDCFSDNEPSSHAFVITGIRGSGKTVLLSSLSNYFKEQENWIIVDPLVKDNLLENIAAELYEIGKVKRLFLKAEFSMSFHGVTFSISGEEPATSIVIIIKKMLDLIKKKGKRVLITIDEADNSKEMKDFVELFQGLLRNDYPVYLLMTGLYDNILKLQDNKSLTFLYRAPKIFLSSLFKQSIVASYVNLLKIDAKLATQMADITKGYAYAYQVLGYLFYDNKYKDVNDLLLSEFDHYLADYVYDKIYSELSDFDQIVVELFKEKDIFSLSEIANKTGKDDKYVSVYRDRLIKKGILASPSYGKLQLCLPRFKEYLENK